MSESEEKVSFGIYIPKSLKKRLKLYCAEHDLKINEVIIQALEEYLSKHNS